MTNENKLVKKVKHLLKCLGCPRWLHHFGPKTYEFFEHFSALLIKAFCRLSYRRTKQLLNLLGITCPSKSALQYTAKKLNSKFWNKILKMTCGNSYLIAIDSTGFSRTNPSYHYLKRIDGKIPKIPIKLSVAFDTREKKFFAAHIRVLPAHDVRDANYLLQHCVSDIIVGDKGYSSEKLYRAAAKQGTILMVPQKKNAYHGIWRRKMQKQFKVRTYHRREMVEAAFSRFKRKFGGSVHAKRV